MRHLLCLTAFSCLIAVQTLTAAESCSAERWNSNQATVAEVRDVRLASSAATTIDPGTNGGVRIHGWNNSDVLVQACIHASASTEEEAKALLKEVNVARSAADRTGWASDR